MSITRHFTHMSRPYLEIVHLNIGNRTTPQTPPALILLISLILLPRNPIISLCPFIHTPNSLSHHFIWSMVSFAGSELY